MEHGRAASTSTVMQSNYTLQALPQPPKEQPALDWLPCTLKPFFLWANAFFCIVLGTTICALLYGVGNDRQALLTSENAHILSTYAPTLIATINVLAFRTVFFETFRMLPYTRMADQLGRPIEGASAKKSIGGSYFPWVFVSYTDDLWLKLFAYILLAVVNVLTTFKSVFLGSQETAGGWVITFHQKPAFYLVAAYATMALFYICIFFWTKSRSTGLRWDPAAPIDHLQLVWHTDALSQISQLPMSNVHAYTVIDKNIRWRLGYWTRTDYHPQRPPTQSTVYGIGMVNGPRESVCNNDGRCTCHTRGTCTFDKRLYSPLTNRIFLSMFLLVLLLSIGLCAYIIARGMFKSGLELSGSWLLLDTNTTTNGTSLVQPADAPNGYILVAGQLIPASDSTTANILFRAVPTFIAGIYATGFIESLDKRLRDTQCFFNLASKPCTTDESLSLDYATQISFMVPFFAFMRSHYRLALVSFVATTAPLFPVFVAGLIIFERKTATSITLLVVKPAFVIVCIYLIFFVLAIIAAWPRKKELLLRPMYSIADFVRPFAHTWLLVQDANLNAAMQEKTQDKFRARVLLAQCRFQLGVTKGTCGQSHRGVDIVGYENGPIRRQIMSADEFIKAQKAHARGNGKTWLEGQIEGGWNGFNMAEITRGGPGR